MKQSRAEGINLPVLGCMIKVVLVYSIHGGVYNLRCKLAVVERNSGNYRGD